MLPDLKLVLRQLAKSPGFTFTAIVTLALGIGLNTSMFSALHAIFLRTLPYPDGERLVRIYRTSPESNGNPHSPANFLDARGQNAVFSGMAALQWTNLNLADDGQPAERLHGLLVTADFFPLLGIKPALGRVFTAEDDRPGGPSVAVLSHELWSGRFAGDPGIVGREIRLDGHPATVVGVMPPGFNDRLLFGTIDAWRPLAFTDAQRTTRRSSWLTVIARLKPGMSLAQAQSGMDTLSAQLALSWPDINSHLGFRLVPLSHGSRIEPDGKVTWFVMGLAGAVLLIACANLASLQFARTAARAHESAVRMALGASRLRLMRGMLTESLLLALAGGGLGVILALWSNDALGSRFLVDGAPGLALPLDLRALGFALLLSATTGVLFGLLPAWLAARADVGDALKQGARGATAARGQHRVRHVLIVAEVALALVLLASAAFFVGGLQRFAQRDLGWRSDGLLTASFDIGTTPEASSSAARLAAHRTAVVERWAERLARIPGVDRVAFARRLPVYGYGNNARFAVEGRPDAPSGREPLAFTPSVTPGFFETLDLPLVAGRGFTAADRAGSLPVVIINESMARALWPGESPLGKRIGAPDPANRMWREVVGVVGDARSIEIGEVRTPFQVYRPWAQAPEGSVTIALRTQLAPESLAAELRRAAAEIDPGQPVHSISSVRRDLDQAFTNLDLAGAMLAAFALLGVLLAALGIYAVISHSVVQRTHELGVRLALGAQTRSVLALVIGRGLRLALFGTLAGLAGAWAVARLLGAIMPGVPLAGGLTLGVAAGTLLTVAFLACWLPARRATKVDPLIALRTE